jgi:LDH2 family malate/lactate/ureidoglycolate dehydrogenase
MGTGADVELKYYPAQRIREFAAALLLGMGASEEEAAIVADGLTTACLWWHPGQGQGLEKFFRYHHQVKLGGLVPQAPMRWVLEHGAVALLDAGKGFGYVAAHRAMRKAVDLATRAGIGYVAVRNSNHFGIAGYHARVATAHGCIGLAMTNATAEMAPWGAKTAALGTNPWGLGVPRRDAPPIVLDMALTMAGIGMIKWALREGRPVPDDWALTADGRRSSDPAELLGGTQLPIGQYKGYGLSLFTDVLTGVLSGAKFGLAVFQDLQDCDVGHVLIAVHIDTFMPREEFFDRLERLIHDVKTAQPIRPGDEILLPGEREFRRMRERERHGVPIDARTVEGLREVAAELKVPFTL